MTSINAKCTDCHLYKETRGEICEKGFGNDAAEIVYVADSPAKLQGDGFKITQDALHISGLLDKVYFTSLIKCRPPFSYTVTPQDIKACRHYLDDELKQLKPKHVITAGVNPTKTLFRGKAKINSVHGEIIKEEKYDFIGMPIFDGAYCVRDPSKTPGLQNDIERLSAIIAGVNEDIEINWGIVRRGNVKQFIKEFRDCEEFAFDLETSGLFAYSGLRYVSAIAIAMPHKTWVIPGFMHPDFQRYGTSPWRHGDALKQLMQLLFLLAKVGKKRAYGQNAKFDNTWLMQMFGGKFELTFDTILAHHLLDENVAHDLTSLCRTYLHVAEYDIPLDEKIGKSKKPMRNYKYCAEDATYTLLLTRIFISLLNKDKRIMNLFHHLTMPAARAMEAIEANGLTIDLEEMDRIEARLTKRRSILQKQLNKLAGKVVNWNSPQQIAQLLYVDLGLPYTTLTKKGKPSTSEAAVLDLRGKHELVDKLIEFRGLTKMISTYLQGFRRFMVGDTLYIDYNLHGTVTGRYSSRIHSIPKNEIRSLIIAPPGWEFLAGDLSQAELRVIAQMSGDKEMLKAYRSGIDLHWRTLMNELAQGGQGKYIEHALTTASTLENRYITNVNEALEILLTHGRKASEGVWPDWSYARRNAKAVNFGYCYGMWEKKFMQMAREDYGWDATLEEATASRKNYFKLYSSVEKWHKHQRKVAHIRSSVRTLTGRLRRLPAIKSSDRGAQMEAERQAINAPVQGTIGDLKAMAMIEIHETLPHDKLKVVGEHHDAVLMIVRTDAKEEMIPKVYQILEYPALLDKLHVNLSVPIVADLELGPWGAGVELKR